MTSKPHTTPAASCGAACKRKLFKMEKSKKRSLVSGLAALALVLLLLYIVFRDKLPEIISALSEVSVPGVCLLLAMGLGYQLIDSAMCMTLLRSRLPELSFRQAFELTFLGAFGLTASGGAITIPMQSVYLDRCGLDAGRSVGLLILKFVYHKSAILIYALVMLIPGLGWLREVLPESVKYVLPGIVIFLLIITALILLCTWKPVHDLAVKLIGLFPEKGKWPERREKWLRQIDLMYAEAAHLKGMKAVSAKVMLLNFLKLTVLYMIPSAALRCMGLDSPDLLHSLILSAMMLLITGVLPNVNGLGPLEFAFVFFYSAVVSSIDASGAMLLYRIVTYFFPFLISLPVFFIVERRLSRGRL